MTAPIHSEPKALRLTQRFGWLDFVVGLIAGVGIGLPIGLIWAGAM